MTVGSLTEKVQTKIEGHELRVAALCELVQSEGRDFTPQERTEVDTLTAELGSPPSGAAPATGLYAELEKQQKLDAIIARRSSPGLIPGANIGTGQPGAQVGQRFGLSPSGRVWATPRSHNKLRVFKNADEAYQSGVWFFATVMGAKWAQERNQINPLAAGQVSGTDADGGYLVPDLIEAAVLMARERMGVARRLAMVVPMGGLAVAWPKETAGQTVYYPDEAADITESKATLGSVPLAAVRRAVLTGVSNQLAENAIIDVMDWVAGRMAYQLSSQEDKEYVLGDGTSAYGGETGLISACGSAGKRTLGSTKTAFTDIAETDLHNVQSLVADQYFVEGEMSWLMRRSTWLTTIIPLIYAMGGVSAYEFRDGIQKPVLLGHPVEFSTHMPASAASKCGVLFGNFFAGTMIGDRKGLAVSMSREAGFKNDVTYLRAISSYDIAVHANPGSGSSYGAYAGIFTAAS